MSRRSDLAWARRSGGTLSRWAQARMTLDILAIQLRRRFSALPPKLAIPLDQLETLCDLPDTPLVKAALEECSEACQPTIVAHSCRTFAWGNLLGHGIAQRPDREALAVAALLHDIELGRTSRRSTTGCTCFACAGAIRSELLCLEHGRTAEWARLVGNAIAMHLDPVVPLAAGVEAHLLQVGAACDVIGAGVGRLSPDVRQWVIQRHPRTGVKAELMACMGRERKAFPKTRAGFLMTLGFGKMIAAAPFRSDAATN